LIVGLHLQVADEIIGYLLRKKTEKASPGRSVQMNWSIAV
jgi:hypothetical protein